LTERLPATIGELKSLTTTACVAFVNFLALGGEHHMRGKLAGTARGLVPGQQDVLDHCHAAHVGSVLEFHP
jgi:hypothetical protein